MKKKYYLFKMNTLFLNILSVVIMIPLFIVILAIYKEKCIELLGDSFIWTFILMVPYLILHEILHSLSYVIHGANFKNITYGAHLEKGILCCLCKQNISKKNILISLLYPFIFIGVITFIMGIIFNNFTLILLSILNISGCSGDLLMFFHLIRIKNFEFSEYNNPIAFGLYTEEDLSSKKMFGLDYVDAKESLERDDLKKIRINKVSIIGFGLIVVLAIVYAIMLL